MTLHLPGLPHVQLGNPMYSFCAYSSKLLRLPAFLDKKDTVVYAPPGSQVFKNEDYRTHSLTSDGVVEIEQSDLMLKILGKPEWDQSMFGHWDMNSELWQTWNARCINEIAKTYQPGDVIGLIAGWCQKQVADAFPGAQAWEWGVGYDGVTPNAWVTFESNAWRSAVRGWRGVWKTTDSVIPNCYYDDEFLPAREHEGYLLFIGRLVSDKGIDIIREISRARPDLKLKVAGQGDITQLPPGTEYMGVVSGRQKAELLAGATALLAPTTYLEPFGGVTIEAAMSGTPPITTNYGVFPETIGGILGYPEWQCTTLDDFVDAVDRATEMNKTSRRVLQINAQGQFGASTAAAKYGRTLEYIEAVGRGESAWYGRNAHLLSS